MSEKVDAQVVSWLRGLRKSGDNAGYTTGEIAWGMYDAGEIKKGQIFSISPALTRLNQTQAMELQALERRACSITGKTATPYRAYEYPMQRRDERAHDAFSSVATVAPSEPMTADQVAASF